MPPFDFIVRAHRVGNDQRSVLERNAIVVVVVIAASFLCGVHESTRGDAQRR